MEALIICEENVKVDETVVEATEEVVTEKNAIEVKLNSLYEQRLISKEEYDEKRKKLLDEF